MKKNALNALEAAVAAAGSQSELARRIGVRQGYIWRWLRAGKIAAEYVLAVEAATGGAVTRHDLRPDVFGPAPSAAPASPPVPPSQDRAA